MAGRENRERISTLVASNWMGAKNGGMCNTCELLINVVKLERLKMLISLDQNGKGYGWNVCLSFHTSNDSLGE